jgi:hypothetical protein
LQIFDSDLNLEFSEQPKKYAFYGGLYADAVVTLDEFKIKIEQYKAEIEPDVRKRIELRYGDTDRFRFSEDKMKAEYARDESLQKLWDLYYEQDRKVKRLEIVKKAFEQRSQMLWNIGATRRQEMIRLIPTNSEES